MQKQINDLLLVSVPEAEQYALAESGAAMIGYDTIQYYRDKAWHSIDVPDIKYNIIGMYPGLTEGQCRSVTESFSVLSDWFVNYSKPKELYNGEFVWMHGFKTALESFTSLMQANGVFLVNPYRHKGTDKPKEAVFISYDGGKTFDESVEWVDKRTCMMAGIAGGNGYFGEGWATSHHGNTDVGLICDPPDFWVYQNEIDLYDTAQESTSAKWVVLQIIK